MFTGIIETTGTIREITLNGSNKTFQISSSISADLRPDQSVAHDGVCLTVEDITGHVHRVTAIQETLQKTNLANWKQGDTINLERCMVMNGRLDGHIVQGHVDTIGKCIEKKDLNGSHKYTFQFPEAFSKLIIEKGSISINGTSLTVFDVGTDRFSVAIIPYTFSYTNISQIDPGAIVNLEFDMIGKYVNRILEERI